MNTSAPSPLGLIELPNLADLLRRAGMDVVSGETYRAAATSIKESAGDHGPLPILVSATPWPGRRVYLEKVAKQTRVVVLCTADSDGVSCAGTVEVALPATLAEVLAPTGLAAPAHLANSIVDTAGSLAADTVDPWETQQMAVTAPPVEDDDSWALPEEDAPTFAPPVGFEQPTPAAPVVEDPWEAQQAPAPVHAPEPAPAFEAPAAPVVTEPVAPPVQAPPVFEAPVQAPVVTEPVAPPVQAVTEPGEFPTDAPGFVVPAPPVFEAPAAPVVTEPAFEQPVPAPPVFEAPVVTEPAFEQPVQAPVVTEPAFEQPVPAPPVFEAPAAPVEVAVFDDVEAHDSLPVVPSAPSAALAEVVVTWAGKGGVGKSSSAFSLAQRAANAGLRVILIDGNLGQGDMRTFLRISNAGLPSIYQAAISGDLKQALIDPETLNSVRSPKLDPLGFAVVQAPPAHLVDPNVVTPEVYMEVVEQARRMCDLVVIDTQIVEAKDEFGMVDRLLLPLLRSGAWGFGVADLSSPGIGNLLDRLKKFAAQGVSHDRQMTVMNRIPRTANFNVDGVASAFNEHTVFLGVIYSDDSIIEHMNRGRAVCDMPVFAPFLDAALSRVTGRSEFAPDAAAAAAAAAHLTGAVPVPDRGGLLSRFRKGKS